MELETDRLLLRQWRPDDFDHYAEYYADEELARYVGGACDRPQAWRRWAAEIGHWTLRGYGFWAVEEKQTGNLAGCVGLWFPDGWPEGILSRRQAGRTGWRCLWSLLPLHYSVGL